MRKISTKMVPRIVTHDQKRQLHISSDPLRNAEMFDRVITGDETWCFQYDRACCGKHRIHLGRIKHVLITGQDYAYVFLRSQWDSSL
jgi:hypothetical protein